MSQNNVITEASKGFEEVYMQILNLTALPDLVKVEAVILLRKNLQLHYDHGFITGQESFLKNYEGKLKYGTN